jgi:hypothetical protein
VLPATEGARGMSGNANCGEVTDKGLTRVRCSTYSAKKGRCDACTPCEHSARFQPLDLRAGDRISKKIRKKEGSRVKFAISICNYHIQYKSPAFALNYILQSPPSGPRARTALQI